MIKRIRYAEDIYSHDPGYEEAEANAQLITAAPDLYEALKKAITYIELTYSETDGEECHEAKLDLQLAQAALAKALGEEK